MNAEFHYYATYWLCAKAGFPPADCEIIAVSSQMVDNALYRYDVDSGGKRYTTLVTQDYVFWDKETLDGIYLPFHFVPGDPAKARAARRDGLFDARAVTAGSDTVKELLVGALKTRDLYRIGIAAHSFADSWAHQNFSARVDPYNAFDPDSALPAVGHLHAFRNPDDPCGLWNDPRLAPGLSRVDNSERFLDAAKKLFRYFRTYLRRDFADEDFVLPRLAAIWGPGRDARSARYDLMIDAEMPEYDRKRWLVEAGIRDETSSESLFSGYDKLLWAKNEIAHRIGMGRDSRRVSCPPDFRDSHFNKWNEAAREHRDLALSLIRSATGEKV